MILISHRGNLNGRDIDNENNPVYIDKALKEGFKEGFSSAVRTYNAPIKDEFLHESETSVSLE